MLQFVRAAALAAVACAAVGLSAAGQDKKEDKKEDGREVLKTVLEVKADYDKSKKLLTITAVGQVPTGGWTKAQLVPRKFVPAPKDGIYEFDLTAVRPDGIVTQALSKVSTTYLWGQPPAELKGIKVYGSDKGAKTVKVNIGK